MIKNYNLLSLTMISILWIVLIVYIWIKAGGRKQISAFLSLYPGLKRHIYLPSISFLVFRFVLYSILALFLSIAILNPALPVAGEEFSRETDNIGVDIIFLVDVSLSMNAGDSIPTRLDTFKQSFLRLLPGLQGNRFGIIAFAGAPFLYCPMTADLSAFADYIRGMDVYMIPDTSTDIVGGFDKAEEILNSKKVYRNKIIVLVSDGENMDNQFPEELSSELIVLGVGTEKGGNIFYRDPRTNAAGYITKNGLLSNQKADDLIVTTLNEEYLKTLTDRFDGDYINLSKNPNGMQFLLKKITGMKKNTGKYLQEMTRKDSYFYFLLPAFVIWLFDLIFLESFLSFTGIRKRAQGS